MFNLPTSLSFSVFIKIGSANPQYPLCFGVDPFVKQLPFASGTCFTCFGYFRIMAMMITGYPLQTGIAVFLEEFHNGIFTFEPSSGMISGRIFSETIGQCIPLFGVNATPISGHQHFNSFDIFQRGNS